MNTTKRRKIVVKKEAVKPLFDEMLSRTKVNKTMQGKKIFCTSCANTGLEMKHFGEKCPDVAISFCTCLHGQELCRSVAENYMTVAIVQRVQEYLR